MITFLSTQPFYLFAGRQRSVHPRGDLLRHPPYEPTCATRCAGPEKIAITINPQKHHPHHSALFPQLSRTQHLFRNCSALFFHPSSLIASGTLSPQHCSASPGPDTIGHDKTRSSRKSWNHERLNWPFLLSAHRRRHHHFPR